MHDYSYSAHLVINDGYEDRLDMTITCQNGQPGNDSDSFTNEGGYWMDSKGEYQGAAFPPHIKGDKIWTRKN